MEWTIDTSSNSRGSSGGRMDGSRAASMAALTGGGLHAKPGEVSLAHRGVLFLDELPEFSAQALDSLRQPIETGEVVVSRANHRATYPARFQLVAAMNPCRCGRALEAGYACKRAPNEKCMAQYVGRLSGPLIDRFDLLIEVSAVDLNDLLLPPPKERSADVGKRVARARAIQQSRFEALGAPDIRTNAAAPAALVEEIARPDAEGAALLRQAAEKLKLSARAFHRILKVGRTLADLDGEEHVSRRHLAEAVAMRARALEAV